MQGLLLICTIACLVQTPSFGDQSKNLAGDPWKKIEWHVLKNGLKVVLFPDNHQKQVFAKLKVNAGFTEEKPSEYGVAHLTEHVLFRYGAEGERSYYDTLVAEGAETNAYTELAKTEYFTITENKRAEWAIDILSKIFLKRPVTKSAYRKAKAETDLETNKLMTVLMRAAYWQMAGDWNQDFGLPKASFLDMGLGLIRPGPSVENVEKFISNYYHPANAELYVVGGFDSATVLSFIEKRFGAHSSEGKVPRVEPNPKLNDVPYEVNTSIDWGAPRILIGTKLWQNDILDEVVIKAYLNHLSNRLMKEIRTGKAETYSVSPIYQLDTRRFGTALLTFETQKENFSSNLNLVQNRLREEVDQGNLSEALIEEAKELFRKKIFTDKQGVKSLMGLAETKLFLVETYREPNRSPLRLLMESTPDEFRASLKKSFQPSRRILMQMQPPKLFPGERTLLFLINVLFAVYIMRKIHGRKKHLTSPANHTVRLSRTLTTRLISGFGASIFVGVLFVLSYYANDLLLSIPVFRTGVVLRDFVIGGSSSIIFWISVFTYFSMFPKNMILEEKQIILLGSYDRTRVIPLEIIEKCELVPTWKMLKHCLSRKVRLFHLGILMPGLFIKTKKGSSYFLGVKDPHTVKDLLDQAINSSARVECLPQGKVG